MSVVKHLVVGLEHVGKVTFMERAHTLVCSGTARVKCLSFVFQYGEQNLYSVLVKIENRSER